jgi:pyruvate dehydrogenase E1 component
MAYDPAFAYELAVIIREGLRRMYEEGESIFYYLTLGNENYPMPAMPEPAGATKEGILKGLYRFKASGLKKPEHRAQLFGSGAIMGEVLKAQALLEDYGVAADVWSVTSYKELHRDALAAERWNMLHPQEEPRTSYVYDCLKDAEGVFVAASDYLKILPDALSRHLPKPLYPLGTDGFGRSEGRADLRNHFEVDARFITLATLNLLAKEGDLDNKVVAKALADLAIDPDKPNPLYV